MLNFSVIVLASELKVMQLLRVNRFSWLFGSNSVEFEIMLALLCFSC